MDTITNTSAVATQPGSATNGITDDVADVSFLNVQAMVWYLTHVSAPTWGRDYRAISWWRRLLFWFRRKSKAEVRAIADRRALLLEHLWTGLPIQWDREHVLRTWMPLGIYTIIERNFARILGAPDRLFDAGFVAGYDSKFGQVWVSRIFNFIAYIGRFLFNVQVLYSRIVPDFLYRLFNLNKALTCLENRWGSTTLRTQYRSLEKQRDFRRDPLEDSLSYLYWAPGMVSSGGRFWGVKPSIRHRLVQFDLVAYLRHVAEFMAEAVVVDDVDILVGGKVVAIRTWFRQEQELPYFTKPTAEPVGNMTRPGWLVLTDITAHTPPTELHPESIQWTVLRQGTRCCAEAGCAVSTYEITVPWWKVWYWIPYLVGFPLSRLIIGLLGLRTKEVNDLTIAQQQYLKLQFAKDLQLYSSRLRYPDRKIQEVAERFEGQSVVLDEPASLILDLVGSTRMAERVNNNQVLKEKYMGPYLECIQTVILPYEHSNRGPDQVVVIWHDSNGDGAAMSFVRGTPTQRLQVALKVAWQLHQRCAEITGPDGQPFKIRVGIERYGDLILSSTKIAPCLFQATGQALNRAARWQEVGKREQFTGPWITVLRAELMAEVADRWEFSLPEDAPIKVRNMNDEHFFFARITGPKTTEGE